MLKRISLIDSEILFIAISLFSIPLMVIASDPVSRSLVLPKKNITEVLDSLIEEPYRQQEQLKIEAQSHKNASLAKGKLMYFGKKISPTTFEMVQRQISRLPNIKGEFESTLSFNKRLSDMLSTLPEKYFIYIPFDSKYAEYDADEQKFKIKYFAIDNCSISYYDVFGEYTQFYQKIKYGDKNIDIVFPSKESIIGTYKAYTKSGKAVRVTRINKNTNVLFEGPQTNINYQDSSKYDILKEHIIAEISANPDEARLLKPLLKAVAVIISKWPFYVTEMAPYYNPSIQNPISINEEIGVIIAQIQYVLIIDAANNVLAVSIVE